LTDRQNKLYFIGLIIITMDELLTIIEERKESIAKMKEQQQGKHKSMLVEEDRKRN